MGQEKRGRGRPAKSSAEQTIPVRISRHHRDMLDAAIEQRRGVEIASLVIRGRDRQHAIAGIRREFLAELIEEGCALYQDRVTISAPLYATVNAAGPVRPDEIAAFESWQAREEKRLNAEAPVIVQRARLDALSQVRVSPG